MRSIWLHIGGAVGWVCAGLGVVGVIAIAFITLSSTPNLAGASSTGGKCRDIHVPF
jgi:hypothetical protein